MSLVREAWEPWQKEYAFGAFYIFPPDELASAVDALRVVHDPVSAAICGAHVSLSEPLRSNLHERQAAEIRARLGSLKTFAIEYGPIRGFAPYPGVALAVGPEDSIRLLRDAIHSTSAYEGATFKRSGIPPHMTIAEFVSIEQSNQLVDELVTAIPIGSFECNEVVLAVPDAGFHFVAVETFPIGSGF